jgi:hypothetical protein
MGLSFHYSGRFNPEASLPAMIEEVKGIAEIYNWSYHVFEDEFPASNIGKTTYNQNIYGICFTPPSCETVFLTFLSNGKISSPSHLEFFGNSKKRARSQYLYMLAVKTQYAGIEIHKIIIHLLKFLNGKYLKDFTVKDEGDYWETGDEKLLQAAFKRNTALIESFAFSLENYPKIAGESYEAYIERLAKQVHDKEV